jgi:hypothetical protein
MTTIANKKLDQMYDLIKVYVDLLQDAIPPKEVFVIIDQMPAELRAIVYAHVFVALGRTTKDRDLLSTIIAEYIIHVMDLERKENA